MTPETLAKIDQLLTTYPLRPFELESLSGERYRIMQLGAAREVTAFGKKHLAVAYRGRIELVDPERLKDEIRFIPGWKRPLNWLYGHPAAVGGGGVVVFSLVYFCLLVNIPVFSPTFPSTARKALPLVTTAETIETAQGPVKITTLKTGDYFTRILTLSNGQSFLETGYINSWGETHIERVTGNFPPLANGGP
jgi:hypothetical protein